MHQHQNPKTSKNTKAQNKHLRSQHRTTLGTKITPTTTCKSTISSSSIRHIASTASKYSTPSYPQNIKSTNSHSTNTISTQQRLYNNGKGVQQTKRQEIKRHEQFHLSSTSPSPSTLFKSPHLLTTNTKKSPLPHYQISHQRRSFAGYNIDTKADPFPTYRGSELSGAPIEPYSPFPIPSSAPPSQYSQEPTERGEGSRYQSNMTSNSPHYDKKQTRDFDSQQSSSSSRNRTPRPDSLPYYEKPPSNMARPPGSRRKYYQDEGAADGANNNVNSYYNDNNLQKQIVRGNESGLNLRLGGPSRYSPRLSQNIEYNYDNDKTGDEDDDYDDDYDDESDLTSEVEFDPLNDDPNAFRLIIPNRYSIEDFLKEKSQRIRRRIELNVEEDMRKNGQEFGDERKSPSLGVMEKFRRWQAARELSQFDDEDLRVDGIDSDLELYGGINLETYNSVVLEPSKQFNEVIMRSREIPEEYQLTHQINPNSNSFDPKPTPLPGVFIAPLRPGSENEMVLKPGTIDKNKETGSLWSKMMGSYTSSNQPQDKTAAKLNNNTSNPSQRIASGAEYLKQRLKAKYPEVADKINFKGKGDDLPLENEDNIQLTITNALGSNQMGDRSSNTSGLGQNNLKSIPTTPLDKRQHFMNVNQKQVYSQLGIQKHSELLELTLPPSKQAAKGYAFSPRDAYEAQMFIIHRIQTDAKLKQSLRDTFKYYTKELDPITGIEACRHLLSIEMYLYLKTLEDTGVKLGFDSSNDPVRDLSMWDKVRGKDQTMSTAAVMALMQQYRTKYLQMTLQDDSGELLGLLEEEWVQLIHLVAEINQEVIRNAYIDTGTAYELLQELYSGVSSDQYLLDFEDQLNCILIQFAKQRRENWDGQAYNSWKDNRLTQLQAGLIHYQGLPMTQINIAQVKNIERQIRQIELMGDDAENAEDMNNDTLVDQIVEELDMTKLKLYINNALLYFYRNHLFTQYGFENDIGALLMTKALYSIPDMNIVYYMDDITDSANRCRDFSIQNTNNDDNDEPDPDHISEDNDDEYGQIDKYDRSIDIAQDRLTKQQFKQQVMKEKLDPDYNENFPAGFRDWFKRKQTDEDKEYEQTQQRRRVDEYGRAGEWSNYRRSTGGGKKKNKKMSLAEKHRVNPNEDFALSSQYLSEGMPQYDGRYDRFGLPNVIQPPKHQSQYSYLVSQRHSTHDEERGEEKKRFKNSSERILETGKPNLKWIGEHDKRQ